MQLPEQAEIIEANNYRIMCDISFSGPSRKKPRATIHHCSVHTCMTTVHEITCIQLYNFCWLNPYGDLTNFFA